MTALLAILFFASLPPGVTDNTTLGDFGPTILVLSVAGTLVVSSLTMYFRAKKLVRAETREFLAGEDGQKFLADKIMGFVDSKLGRAALSDFTWGFLKGDDFGQWMHNRVDSRTESQTKILLEQMKQLTVSVGGLAEQVQKLVSKLEAQSEQMMDLERKFMNERVQRAERAASEDHEPRRT